MEKSCPGRTGFLISGHLINFFLPPQVTSPATAGKVTLVLDCFLFIFRFVECSFYHNNLESWRYLPLFYLIAVLFVGGFPFVSEPPRMCSNLFFCRLWRNLIWRTRCRIPPVGCNLMCFVSRHSENVAQKYHWLKLEGFLVQRVPLSTILKTFLLLFWTFGLVVLYSFSIGLSVLIIFFSNFDRNLIQRPNRMFSFYS